MRVTIVTAYPATVTSLLLALRLCEAREIVSDPHHDQPSRLYIYPAGSGKQQQYQAGDFAAFQAYAQPIKLIDSLNIDNG
jgi:hypothetical protein